MYLIEALFSKVVVERIQLSLGRQDAHVHSGFLLLGGGRGIPLSVQPSLVHHVNLSQSKHYNNNYYYCVYSI